MRVGISIQSVQAVRDVREGAAWMVERARAAREAGLDSLFVGDHHATPLPYYQNTAILGRLLAEWNDRPAGALYLLPLWHPLIVAEQVGTLASLARGPFVLQCAVGPDDPQFPAMGVSARERATRFEETLALLRRLFAGETVNSEGHWKLEGARIAPTPPEPVRVWIGAVAPRAVRRAARMGDGWLAAPAFGLDAAREQIVAYRQACEAEGRPVGDCVIRRDVFVGEDADQARAVAGPVLDAGYRGFPPDAPVVGSAEEVAATFRALADMGYDEVLVRNLVPAQRHAVASIERLKAVRGLLA